MDIKKASTKRLEKKVNQLTHDKKRTPKLKYMLHELKKRAGMV